MAKREPKKIRTADDLLDMPREKQRERAERLLAERIVYHENRRARERAAAEGAGAARTMTLEEFLAQNPKEREARTMRLLAERIVYHERKLEEERSARDPGEDPGDS